MCQHMPPHVEQVLSLPAQTIDLLKREFVYMNVHTELYPSGEVRGQLRRAVGAKLAGRHQTPPVETDEGATFEMRFTDEGTAQLQWTLTTARMASPVMGVHLHGPASPGENAPPLQPFLANLAAEAGDDSFSRNAPIQATVDLLPTGSALLNTSYGRATLIRVNGTAVRYSVRFVGVTPTELRIALQSAPARVVYTLAVDAATAASQGIITGIPTETMDQLKSGGWLLTAAVGANEVLGARAVFGSHLTGVLDLNARSLRMLYDGELYINVHTMAVSPAAHAGRRKKKKK